MVQNCETHKNTEYTHTHTHTVIYKEGHVQVVIREELQELPPRQKH